MNQDASTKDTVFIVIFLILIFFGIFFIFFSLKKSEVKKQISVRMLDRNMSRNINEKIQKLQIRNKIFKSKILEASRVDKNALFDDNFFNKESKYELNVFERQISEATEVAPQNIFEKIQGSLSSTEIDKQEKESYKRQIIKRARKQGWSVEINDNLDIISAKKL